MDLKLWTAQYTIMWEFFLLDKPYITISGFRRYSKPPVILIIETGFTSPIGENTSRNLGKITILPIC